MPRLFITIDPRELRVAPSRPVADPGKLHRQIAAYGSSVVGMPPILVYEAFDGVFVIQDGMTRATRTAKLSPGTMVTIEVLGKLKRSYASEPTIGETLP